MKEGCDILGLCLETEEEEKYSPLFWTQCVGGYTDMFYELNHAYPNGTVVMLAQVAPIRDADKKLTGNWQSQFTCKVVDHKLVPLKNLAACIIQISWYFGMTPDTVKEQLEPFGVFKEEVKL